VIRGWDRFVRSLQKIGVEPTQYQLDLFKIYYNLLLETNRRVNLISRRDEERILSYHFIDSLVCLPLIPENSVVCDLGSGNGLPGIPIKILRDGISLYLIESVGKKWLFLKDVISKLGLENTHAINKRAEEVKDIKFDVVLARLFGKLRDVIKVGFPLLKSSGRLLVYKSKDLDEEIGRAEKLLKRFRAEIKEIKEFPVPGSYLRKIVVIGR